MAQYTLTPQKYHDMYDEYFKHNKNSDILINMLSKYHNDPELAMSSDPVIFAYIGFGATMRPDQIFEMDEMIDNQRIITISSRQRGKSFVRQIMGLWVSFYNKFPQGYDRTTKVIVLSMTDDEAARYISEIRNLMAIGDRRLKDIFKGKLGDEYFSGKIARKGDTKAPASNMSQLPLYNNGWNLIRSFPPTNRARGKPASVLIMDEVAIWDEIGGVDAKDVYYAIANPMKLTAPTCKYWVTSTPKKPVGLFYDLCPIDGHNSNYTMIWLPYYDIKDEVYQKNVEEDRKLYISNGEYDRFRQEYLAEFIDVGDSFFDENDHIEKVFDSSLDMYNTFPHKVTASLDFGGAKNSHTVINIVWYDEVKDIVYRIYHRRYPVGKDSTLKEDVLELSKFFNIYEWVIDSQGAGSTFYSWFRDNFGSDKVTEFVFRADKRDMYNQLRIACYKGKIKSYVDKDLMREFRAYTPDYKPMKGETDDLLDALGMGVYKYILPRQDNNYSDFLNKIKSGLTVNRNSSNYIRPNTIVQEHGDDKWWKRL